jgi:hypothetical protein
MKITSAEIGKELSRPEVYLRHYGKLYRITALATTHEEANSHMEANEGEGLLAHLGGFCFVAKDSDDGVELPGLPTVQAAAERLFSRANDASPRELNAAVAWLEGKAEDPRETVDSRGVARKLAAALRR